MYIKCREPRILSFTNNGKHLNPYFEAERDSGNGKSTLAVVIQAQPIEPGSRHVKNHDMLNRKIIVLGIIAGMVTLGVAATNLRPVRNLKVLPGDISDQKLDSIMQTYTIALGVKCGFCHVPSKAGGDSLDYASDAEPMKEEARKMMRMTIDINRNNFYFDKSIRPEYLNVVHCNTCHRGEPFPEE